MQAAWSMGTDTTLARRRDVMGQSFSLGRIAGIRIGVNWSVLLIVALLAYGLAAGQFPAEVPRRPEAEYVVAAIVTAVAYIASLLAHELAHSLVARRNGVQVEGITLWLLGGVSRLQGEVPTPGAEVRLAGVRSEERRVGKECRS